MPPDSRCASSGRRGRRERVNQRPEDLPRQGIIACLNTASSSGQRNVIVIGAPPFADGTSMRSVGPRVLPAVQRFTHALSGWNPNRNGVPVSNGPPSPNQPPTFIRTAGSLPLVMVMGPPVVASGPSYGSVSNPSLLGSNV